MRDTPELRLVKLAAVAFLGVIVLVMLAAKFLVPEERQGRYITAEQERACTQAYLSGDTKLVEAMCDPGHWRQPGGSAGSQASLP